MDAVVLCGIQGAGKTTRRPYVDAARTAGLRVTAVWVDVAPAMPEEGFDAVFLARPGASARWDVAPLGPGTGTDRFAHHATADR